MAKVSKIQCPHCNKNIDLKRNCSGKIIGIVAGGGIGYVLAAGLGIAGAIAGISIAAPAALVGLGIGALLGNQAGKKIVDSTIKCPNCDGRISV